MKRIKITAYLDYDDETMHSDDAEAIEWFVTDILMGCDESLFLHSNELGETIGELTITDVDMDPPQPPRSMDADATDGREDKS